MSHPSVRVTLIAACLAAVTTGLAVSAVYAEPIATVRFGDLDLRSPVGQKMLSRRIALAAGRVCDQGVGAITVAKCRSELVAQIRSEVRTAAGQGL